MIGAVAAEGSWTGAGLWATNSCCVTGRGEARRVRATGGPGPRREGAASAVMACSSPAEERWAHFLC